MPTPQQLQNLHSVVPYAQASERKWNVRASVSLAQWTYEAGWGTDKIAVECLNCFGIKHLQANKTEPYKEYKTPEYDKGASQPHYIIDAFVKYAGIADSFDAHGKLLATASRYQPAMTVADDPYAFARQLQLCGYSTSPKYASSLCAQIDALGLKQYDLHAS